MKFKVQMKDPDTLGDAIERAVTEVVEAMPDLSGEERDAVVEKRTEAIDKLCGRWFEYGEYLTVEIDTDAGTCVVVPLHQS
jgi:hypothetical protein